MGFRDPKHPIWGIVRLAVIGVILTVVLAVNAKNFDASELKVIAEVMAALGVVKGIETKLGGPA